jgi:hypothetical protein
VSFHKRFISNEQVIRLYNDGGINNIIQWYTRGVDAIVTETGIASRISKILNKSSWSSSDPVKLNSIIELIQDHIETKELKK